MVTGFLTDAVNDLVGNNSSNGKNNRKKLNSFKRTLRTSNFFSSDLFNINSGKYTELGKYQVNAGQLAEVGQGDARLDPMEQGRPQITLKDSSGSVQNGFIKITHESPTGNEKNVIVEERSEEFDQSTRTERLVLPRATSRGTAKSRLEEDEQIGLYYKPDSDGTELGNDETITRLPITLYE